MEIVYQPVFRLADRFTVGYEALVRWDNLKPRELFRRAAEAGEEVALDRCCLSLAKEGARVLPPGARLFVNLRPATVQAVVRGEVDLSELSPAVFELPEEDGWWDGPEAWALLRARFRSLGEVALDDVGEGFQDLRRLRLLRPAWIKAGLSLVRSVDRDREARAILRSLVLIGHSLEAKVIAEGIETEEELQTCLALGVEYGQGFLLSPPLPAKRLPAPGMEVVGDAR